MSPDPLPSGPASSFGDLRARVISGAAMAAVGVAAVWAGGLVFAALVAVLCGLMVWELACMLAPEAERHRTLGAGLVAGAGLLAAALWLSGPMQVLALLILVAMLAYALGPERRLAAPYLALILLAGLGLVILRAGYGWDWVLWLVLVVVGSDVAGYFAGRVIGGPKLWPRVSPKKTWSGTVAGWVLAALIGWVFMGILDASVGLILASVLVGMAGQAGDIAESAIKRHAGVKDSSNLIPGHGGVMDRFDAMIAAAVIVLILAVTGALDALAGCPNGRC